MDLDLVEHFIEHHIYELNHNLDQFDHKHHHVNLFNDQFDHKLYVLDNHYGLMVEFWDKTWSRKYERYTRHHQEIWDYLNSLDVWRGRVCDLGCGPCVMYEGKKIDLTGVDWSQEALNQAKLHYPQGIYIQASAIDTGLPSGEFDTVVSCGMLDYFDDWTPVVMEARRILKPGGKFYATLLNGFQGHDWTQFPRVAGNWHLVIL